MHAPRGASRQFPLHVYEPRFFHERLATDEVNSQVFQGAYALEGKLVDGKPVCVAGST
jgi:hypothetical protein